MAEMTKGKSAVIGGVAGIVAGVAVAAGSGSFKGYERGPELPLTYGTDVCKATDGDTIRCGNERVRLVEIDAPELPGHCVKTRVCAPGDGKASKASLEALLKGQKVKLVRYDVDHYGRTLADARVRNRSLSCAQVTAGQAMRQLKWGDYGVLHKDCP
jgi:endonuclease YncB( thermonuclease family)